MRFSRIIQRTRELGPWWLLHRISRAVYCRNEMWLLRKTCRPTDGTALGTADVTFRRATPKDCTAIIHAWPEDFRGKATGSQRLAGLLDWRFREGIPCFVACRGEEIAAAVWCGPWHSDANWPPELQREDACEIVNLFVAEGLRRKGIAKRLLLFCTEQMATRGIPVAYSRVMVLRPYSIRAHEKAGFQQLGLMKDGSTLGRRFCSLDTSVWHSKDEDTQSVC